MTAGLSGCVEGPDESVEQLSISITDVGRSPYVIHVPMWLSPDGSTPPDWFPHGKIHSGQVTEFDEVQNERGRGLRIAGNGTVTIGFADVRTAGPPAFIGGRMSFGTGADDVRPVFFVEKGDVDVVFMYQGQSKHCYLPVSASWNSQGEGWSVAQSYSRQDQVYDCQ